MSLYRKFTLEGNLTKEQITFFHDNGFLHFEKFADHQVVQRIIRSTEELQASWILNKLEKINGVPIKYGVDEHGNTIVQRFAFTNLHSPEVTDFANSKALDALKVLLPKEARIG